LETIATYDDPFAEKFLEDKLTLKYTRSVIRKLLHGNPLKFCPVLIGSALKNKGIQPLMDAVIHYLPFPSERPQVEHFSNPSLKRDLVKSEKFLGYVYKVISDPKLGSLAYTRIYSGELGARSTILNSTLNLVEKIGHVYRVRANRYVAINSASAGDIVAIASMKNPVSGTTLINQGDPNFVLS
jgi:elongation factor G